MLALTSLMSANADFFVRSLADYIASQLGTSIEIVEGVPWQERERMLDRGEIDIAWICGLPYTLKADRPSSVIELLAAPVMLGSRYQGRPVYFSDVVVRQESQFREFADLRHTVWAYNEKNSHSGYNVVRYYLATIGEPAGYFDKVIESGSHLESLQLVLNRKADISAIDSTVLELERDRQPAVRSQLRVIHTLGPSPIPPWVVSKNMPRELRAALKETLLHMHENAAGKHILTKGQVARFEGVVDSYYDPIRSMSRQAASVSL